MIIAELRGTEALLIRYIRRCPEPTVSLILDFARSEANVARSEAVLRAKAEPVATTTRSKKAQQSATKRRAEQEALPF